MAKTISGNKIPKNKEAFLREAQQLMVKHKVPHCVFIYSMNDEVNNTYMNATGEDSQLYCHISDAMQAWMSQITNN